VDYGHELRFGTFITPQAQAPDAVVALARVSELAGLDLVSVQDHPYQPRFLDAWTLLSVIGAATEQVTVFPNVANLPLRSPAVLARSVASLDLLTGGRVELGLGTGAFWEAIVANGGPQRSPGEAVRALEEAIEIIRGLWSPSGPVRVAGEHYRVVGAKAGPAPAHDVGIWLGAYGPRMLRVTGRLADGWLPSQGYLGPDKLADANRAIDEAAGEAGRSPSDVRRLYNVNGSFGRGGGFLQGSPEDWAEQLAELSLGEGMSAYVLTADDPDLIRRFGGEVAPRVRELVEAERLRPAASAAAGEPGPDAVRARTAPAAGTATSRLGVTPTPDDGTRLSGVRLWDEATRPTGPVHEGGTYSGEQRAAGQHLVDVHDHLRSELAQIRDLVDQVAAGTLDVAAARSHVNAMALRQNNWTLGTYCESYCRVVTTHHTLEDRGMFPHLRRAEPGLEPVIDRLEAEHHVIHDVIERVDRALVALVAGPDGMTGLRAEVDLLTDTLLSHFAYEERELVEPMARLGLA
jgi:alkanesulfonate monooxygenase SsuD/methylene tetrahydromethanopterin reductase-like flavin-dependent oxidoreductase (luciferase family)/hemerythrin-like domain-containing protein